MPKMKKERVRSTDQKYGGGLMFDTGRGQHILINPLVINAIVEKANIRNSDTVLEIGPGTGNLTVKLLAFAKKVIAYEVDPRMVSELYKRVQGKPYAHKLTVVRGDALKSDFPFFNVCVANVPYAISSPLVFKLLNHRPFFRCAVLMFQREFAMRMVAKPPSPLWGRLSINCQLLAKVDHLMKVTAKSFKPPPQVESSVIRMEQRNPPPPINFEEWDAMIKMCLSRKHRVLHGLLRQKRTLQPLLDVNNSFAKLSGKPELNMEEFKEIMSKIMDSVPPERTEPLGELRSAQLKLDDFLFLLAKCVEFGVRFK